MCSGRVRKGSRRAASEWNPTELGPETHQVKNAWLPTALSASLQSLCLERPTPRSSWDLLLCYGLSGVGGVVPLKSAEHKEPVSSIQLPRGAGGVTDRP